MPEGAEVRVTADWLRERLVGSILRHVQVIGGRFAKQPIVNIADANNEKIVDVRCKGKVIVVDLEGETSLVSTLGMTGRWSSQPDKHAAVVLHVEKPPTRGMRPLYFVDQRRFGNLKIVDTSEANAKLDELGWDPLADPTGHWIAYHRLNKRTKKFICEVLLEQSVFAGVGNYVRAEALYRAEIDPWSTIATLSDERWKRLHTAIVDVCAESYRLGGASIESFLSGDGEPGGYAKQLQVYGKTTDPDGRAVLKKKDRNGRMVWYVEGRDR